MEDSPRPTKRIRPSRAGKPKQHVCSFPDCGKSYSRAEHRARHELNRKYKVLVMVHSTDNWERQSKANLPV